MADPVDRTDEDRAVEEAAVRIRCDHELQGRVRHIHAAAPPLPNGERRPMRDLEQLVDGSA
jgi:hypothetical protein